MKKTVPILITAICGIVLTISPFIPATVSWGETASVWFDVLAAIAFILGGGNLLKVHFSKVNRKEDGWAYSGIILFAFLLTLVSGLFKLGVPPARDQEFRGQTFATLQLESMPTELISQTTLNDSLPEPFELPGSVKRQLTITENRDDSYLLNFKGWMQPFQKSDLINISDRLEWLAAVDRLAQQAQPPAELQGKVTYYGDHQSLSVKGTLSDSQISQLKALSNSSTWIRAIDTLAKQANVLQTFAVDTIQMPQWFIIPDQVDNIQWESERDVLKVNGPLSDADIALLARSGAPRIVEWRTKDYKAYLDQLKQQIEMTDEQSLSLEKAFSTSGLADALIIELNLAGIATAKQRSAEQMLQQQQNGEIVVQTLPAEQSITISEQQSQVIHAFFDSPGTDLEMLLSQLQQTEDWPDEFNSVVSEYFNGVTTQANFKAELFELLSATYEGETPFPQTLSTEAKDLLLAEYRAQRLWEQSLYRIADSQHQTKYPWSGPYRANGSLFWWLYEYAFKPLTATMFALLAFYVASAAFRAFRAKNLEAILLLGTAFIILAGRTPLGVAMTSQLPEELAYLKVENITMIVMTVFNTAGNRAIMIGIALGIASTSLKILMGVDRSYLGSDD